LLLSYYANVPSGPAIILTCGVAYLVSLLVGPRGSLLRQMLPRKHLDA
jgi:zinc/manganese transport system permease protein